jgi:hypothetical protein
MTTATAWIESDSAHTINRPVGHSISGAVSRVSRFSAALERHLVNLVERREALREIGWTLAERRYGRDAVAPAVPRARFLAALDRRGTTRSLVADAWQCECDSEDVACCPLHVEVTR